MSQRVSKLREVVLATVHSTMDHPTAEGNHSQSETKSSKGR